MGINFHGESSASLLDDWAFARIPSVAEHSMVMSTLAPFFLIFTAAVSTAAFLLTRRWSLAALSIAAPALTMAITQAAKHVVDRTIHGNLALPSGHTAVATSLLLILGLALLRGARSRPTVAALGVFVGVTAGAAAVGAVLTALRWHYPTDAVAGFLTAVAITLGVACGLDALLASGYLNRAFRYVQAGSSALHPSRAIQSARGKLALRALRRRLAAAVERRPVARPILLGVAVTSILLLAMAGVIHWRDKALTISPTSAMAANSAMAARQASASASAAAAQSAAAEAQRLHLAFPADRPVRLLFMGDSVLEGYYATAADRTSASLIAQGLGRFGPVAATNAAVAGHTVTDGLQVPLGRTQYDLVVLMYGNNDIFKSSGDAFARDYPQLIAKVRATSPGAAVLCLPPWIPSYVSVNGNMASTFFIEAQRQCEAAGGVFVDSLIGQAGGVNNAPIGTVNYLGPPAKDYGHPSDLGHQVIADAALGMISVESP
jgi:undecaprenyl-diphosphatase